MILDDITIDNRIREGILEYQHKTRYTNPISKSMAEPIKDTFKKLMNEKSNINKNFKEQESLLDNIIFDTATGRTQEQIFRDNGDNRHMAGYDNLLREGEAEKIINVLNSYCIPTEALKGVPLGRDFTPNSLPGFPDISINEIVDEEEGSLVIVTFQVIYKGKIIYDYQYDLLNKIKSSKVVEGNYEQPQVKQNKRVKSKYEGSYYIDDDNIPIKKWKDKNNRTFYTKGSKRVSKKYVMGE